MPLLLLRSACTLVSMLSLIDFSYIIRCREELVDFLIKLGVLISTITCNKCGNVLNIKVVVPVQSYKKFVPLRYSSTYGDIS